MPSALALETADCGTVTETSTRIQDHYPADFGGCFACGRDNPDGLHLSSVEDGDSVVTFWHPERRLRGTETVLHGGISALLLDEVGAAAAFRAFHDAEGVPLGALLPVDFVTATMTVDYLAPVPMDQELEIRATVAEQSERKAWIHCTISASGTPCINGKLLFVRPRR